MQAPFLSPLSLAASGLENCSVQMLWQFLQLLFRPDGFAVNLAIRIPHQGQLIGTDPHGPRSGCNKAADINPGIDHAHDPGQRAREQTAAMTGRRHIAIASAAC